MPTLIFMDVQVQYWGQASDIYGRHCSGTSFSSNACQLFHQC